MTNTTNTRKLRPITLSGPLRTIHKCPYCEHYEISRRSVRYDGTRADGRIRTHIANCARAAVATTTKE